MTIATLSATAIAASTLINRAIRILIQTSSGETPTTQETSDALESMNSMLDGWRNEGLMSEATLDESFTLVASQRQYLIGAGGDFNTNRPVRIAGAYITDNGGVSYQIKIVNAEEYASIGLKSSQSTRPQYIYYEPDMPLGSVYCYPVPSAAYTLHLLTWTPVLTFATAATTAYLAPGWQEAIVRNLVVNLAPEYQQQVTQDMMMQASTSKAWVKRANSRPMKLYTDLGMMFGGRKTSIITGI
jgi:hypothetical protein